MPKKNFHQVLGSQKSKLTPPELVFKTAGAINPPPYKDRVKTASGPSVQSDVLNLQKQTAYYDPECDLPPSDFYTMLLAGCLFKNKFLYPNFIVFDQKTLFFRERDLFPPN